jgi:lantibiotic modifying enzyme
VTVAAMRTGPPLQRRQEEPRAGGSPEGAAELHAAALALGRAILDRSRLAKDGSITWQRPNRSTVEGAPPLVPAGPHLYDGLPGIAVLFAALARTGQDDGYRDLSLRIVAPLRHLLRRLVAEPERARSLRLGIGGLVGLGSFVYALVTLGRILDLPELFAEAHQVAGLIAPEHIAADTSLDVVSGAPGAILALLAVARCAPCAAPAGRGPIEAANRCADHLLSRRIDRPDGTTVWATDPRFPPVTGFAHGTAGICCALLKLAARTGRRELLETALRGWAFERSTFDEEHQDWIDQTSPAPRFLNQWCFGAPGITLARLATLDQVADDAVWREIRAGLQVTSAPSLSPLDHLCCGDMGRAEVLIYAADRLREPRYADTARDLARRVLAKAERAGRFHGLVRSAHPDPALFSGDAGIAYTLLRLAFPGELPCLLAME